MDMNLRRKRWKRRFGNLLWLALLGAALFLQSIPVAAIFALLFYAFGFNDWWSLPLLATVMFGLLIASCVLASRYRRRYDEMFPEVEPNGRSWQPGGRDPVLGGQSAESAKVRIELARSELMGYRR